MKEVLGSLPEVITAYKNYNLLVPTATDVQLNPFYKFHVEEVPVDLGENSGDIFKVGSVKTGKKDERGKDIWEDVFSLSKPLLNKMAIQLSGIHSPNMSAIAPTNIFCPCFSLSSVSYLYMCNVGSNPNGYMTGFPSSFMNGLSRTNRSPSIRYWSVWTIFLFIFPQKRSDILSA